MAFYAVYFHFWLKIRVPQPGLAITISKYQSSLVSKINSRGRLLDLEASKLPSGGDGSIGEVCPGCASAAMPGWSQPRIRIPPTVATVNAGGVAPQQLCQVLQNIAD